MKNEQPPSPTQIAQRAIAYNANNMPVSIEHTKEGNTVTTTFLYDGAGSRAKKTVSGGSTTYYIGAHFEIKDGVVTKYIFAGNLRIAQVKGTELNYFHKDHLGSSTAMSDSAGAKVETAEYMPFGSMRDHSGQAVSDYKFTDQELDAESGLYNYNARLYDPVIGRFISADPTIPRLYDPQSLNRYTYCRNNPLVYVDPTGLIYSDGPDYDWSVDLWGDEGDSEDSGDDYGWMMDPQTPLTDEMIVEAWAFNVLSSIYNGFLNNPSLDWVGKSSEERIAAMQLQLQEFSNNITRTIMSIDFNPVKFGVGSVNFVWGIYNGTKAAAIMTTGTASIPFTGGLSGPPAYLYGALKLKTMISQISRGSQQIRESLDESLSDSSLKNLWGLVGCGQKFDDNWEPGPVGYFGGLWDRFVAEPWQGRIGIVRDWIRDYFAFD